MKGTTPIYRFMREKGRDNFSITCIEDNVPVSDLIQREDYWIKQMNPTLNKNINLTMTEQERDRLKYLKNREKRLKQVNDRRLAKYDEIREQKRQHFHEQQTQLENAVIIPYDTNPCFTQDILQKYNLLNLKIIAKRFNLTYSHRKNDLIEHILREQSHSMIIPLQMPCILNDIVYYHLESITKSIYCIFIFLVEMDREWSDPSV